MIEQNDRRPSRVLRGIVITLMALTVALTLLGGIGTTCVALGAENFGSMAVLVPYKPLYLALVVVSVVVGVWGIPVTISLVRGRPAAYRDALLVLILGTVAAGVQTGVSQMIRGSSAPANVRFLVSALTLMVFLLLRLPPIWDRVGLAGSTGGGGSKAASAGAALAVCGVVTLTTHLWAGPTHLAPDGTNWVHVLQTPLNVIGGGMLVVGIALPLARVWHAKRTVIPRLTRPI